MAESESVAEPTEHPPCQVLLFHHAQGRTPGVLAFADRLRAAGHHVHVPDLFDGRLFDSIEAGMAYSDQAGGMDRVMALADQHAADLPPEVVYIGFSLGVVAAQHLAQHRPGARGAVLCYSFIPQEFFGPWPDGVPLQVHGSADDPFFAGEGDLAAAREVVDARPDAELFLYPGDAHYFADASLPSYDAAATDLLVQRTLAFLAAV